MAWTFGFRVPRLGRALRLTPRLILYIVVVAAVPVVLMGFIGFSAGIEGIKRNIEAHLLSVVTVKSQEVERWFRPLEAASRVLVSSSLVRNEVAVLVSNQDGVEAVLPQKKLLPKSIRCLN